MKFMPRSIATRQDWRASSILMRRNSCPSEDAPYEITGSSRSVSSLRRSILNFVKVLMSSGIAVAVGINVDQVAFR